ncbi:MAG TPA: hypothetical protein VNQ73_00420 [Ilumatobacter sp.]|nr:hypothetical protein [Ilumatobacter sp.]
MRTELRVGGANCATCLNETLDALRAMPGIRAVTASSTAGCLAIEHDDVPVEQLASTIQNHLHGVAMYGAEIVMVSVEALVADLYCGHCAPGAG